MIKDNPFTFMGIITSCILILNDILSGREVRNFYDGMDGVLIIGLEIFILMGVCIIVDKVLKKKEAK